MTFKTPKEGLEAFQTLGNTRVNLTMDQTFVLSFMSGLYIGLGGLLAIVVGGNVPALQATNPGLQKLIFGTTFSVGLMFVVLTGSDLWTGTITISNMTLLTSGKTRLLDVIYAFKTIVMSFIGNFCGAVFVAFFFCYLINMNSTEPWVAFLKNLGVKKATRDPWFLFVSAIGCNILVNTAVFMSVVSGDVSGKLLSIFAAIGTFVTIGFEHLVANMFFLPAAAMFGANIQTWQILFQNIAVVAFGNYIGGVFFFGFSFYYGHLWRPSHKSHWFNLISGTYGKAKSGDVENPSKSQPISHDTGMKARELDEQPLQPTAVVPKQTEFQV